MERKTVHFSIDDCEKCFVRLCTKHYKCLWDDSFFHLLRGWHLKYGAKFTLYTYTNFFDGHSIQDVPNTYKNDFRSCVDWLKIGFHASNSNISIEEIKEFARFQSDFFRVRDCIVRFAEAKNISTILRLHYWYATSDERLFLQKQGIKILLTADKEGGSYSLPRDVLKNIESCGYCQFEHLNFIKTHLRIENFPFKRIPQVIRTWTCPQPFVVFTHEWALSFYNRIKTDYLLSILSKKGYTFICQ